MNGVLGEILPLAVAVAISPLPIIAAILMLLSPRARANGLGFLAGWTVGIALATTILVLLSSLISAPAGRPPAIVGIIKIVLGLLLLVFGIVQWRRRPRPGVRATSPKCMSAVDSMTAGKAAVLGFAFAAVNPKNFMMAVTAGVTIGTAGLTAGLEVTAVGVFVLVAIVTIAGPVIAYLIAADRVRAPLGALRGWLVANNAVIMSVLLLVIGVVNVGKGISSF